MDLLSVLLSGVSGGLDKYQNIQDTATTAKQASKKRGESLQDAINLALIKGKMDAAQGKNPRNIDLSNMSNLVNYDPKTGEPIIDFSKLGNNLTLQPGGGGSGTVKKKPNIFGNQPAPANNGGVVTDF